MRRTVRGVLLGCGGLWVTGCSAVGPRSEGVFLPTQQSVATAVNPVPLPTIIPATAQKALAVHLPPYLLHLPGIGGARSIDVSLVRGFRAGGFKGDVEIYDWTEDDSGIDALHSFARNHREAKIIADKIIARHRSDPNAPIYLTCHSGGAGLAVWALEDLPPAIRVKDLLFMSPALSPSYDLTSALRHVSDHAYVFSSLSDQLVLGVGTRVFGTIDGVKTDAAGRVGFTKPASADAGQYAKLVPEPYDLRWLQYDNYGDHVGGMNRSFSEHLLLPLLLSGTLPVVPPLPATRPAAVRPATGPFFTGSR